MGAANALLLQRYPGRKGYFYEYDAALRKGRIELLESERDKQ